MNLSSIEFCPSGGGMALGLRRAGFEPTMIVDRDDDCASVLCANRVAGGGLLQLDVEEFPSKDYKQETDLLVAGLPLRRRRNRIAGLLRHIELIQPRAVFIEDVPAVLSPDKDEYREIMKACIDRIGYWVDWRVYNAADFGVPQFCERVMIVALKKPLAHCFKWPHPSHATPTIGEALKTLMTKNNWRGAVAWEGQACAIAPTLERHFGRGAVNLGSSAVQEIWESLGVDGSGIARAAPESDFEGNPQLTLRMIARLQGFPDHWRFFGNDESIYRQIVTSMPPALSYTIDAAIHRALSAASAKKANT